MTLTLTKDCDAGQAGDVLELPRWQGKKLVRKGLAVRGATEPSAELLALEQLKALGWNGARSYLKDNDLDLEYSTFDELLEAYAKHLEV
jgi:hypothetical protein